MISPISELYVSTNGCLYDCRPQHSNIHGAMDELLSGLDKKIDTLLTSGVTPKAHLVALKKLAEENHHESVELLHNIALGTGDIANEAANILCAIQFKKDKSAKELEAASNVQSCAQELVIYGKKFSCDALTVAPKTLLMAGAVSYEAPHKEIPGVVKQAIVEYDKRSVKPLWWCEHKPKGGQFESGGESRLNDVISCKADQHQISADGACQFRAYLAITTKDCKWLDKSQTDKASILQLLNETKHNANMTISQIIKRQIKDAINYLKEAGFPLEGEQEQLAVKLYEQTIGTGRFDLWSGNRIVTVDGFTGLNPEQAENLANAIGQGINNVLNIPTNPKHGTVYAKQNREKNHFDLVAPQGFFSKTHSEILTI